MTGPHWKTRTGTPPPTSGEVARTLQAMHPWLTHYQSAGCEPTGTTGQWWAATGNSTDPEDPEHPEQWQVNLAAVRRRAGPDLDQLRQRRIRAGRRGLHRQCGGLDR